MESDINIVELRTFLRLIFGVLFSLCFIAFSANAQVDPSSALLLRSSGDSDSANNLDSNRYTVRPGPRTPPKKPPVVKVAPGKEPNYSDTNVKPKPIVAKPKKPSPKKAKEPELSQSDLRAISKKVADYKKLLDPRDSRHNILEIKVAPTYIYNDSESAYWFRKYTNHGAGLDIAANVWFTPFFGLHVGYLTTLGSEIKGDPGSSKKIEADHQWIDASFQFRNYFGISRKSSYLSFGLGFQEYQFLVPKDESNRVRLKSSGARLSMEAGIPKTSTYHWLLGVELIPRADHSEVETGLNLKSGSNASSDVLGLWVGGKFQFDRGHSMFWKLSHSTEKTLYKGTANTNDPVTGAAPDGVSVTNGFTRFQLGVTWGD